MALPDVFKLRHGLIVWLDDCPPLDDVYEKRRPIIVVDPSVANESGTYAIVIAASATAGSREPDAVPLPNRADDPRCTTGLPRPCAAIPRWFFPIRHDKLRACTYSGTLGGRPLRALLAAHLVRRDAVDDLE